MIGKPESVSFMIKNLCCVECGIMFAIELQEGKVEMATSDFIRDGEKPTTGCVLRLMSSVAGEGVVLFGDSWVASLNTLQKLHAQGNFFAGIVKTAHSGIPLKVLRDMFTAGSARGDTITVHLGDGPDRIYAHAWNEPGWKNGKAPKKGQKVFILNCYTSAPVSTWDKPRTFLRADGSVGHGEVKVPQTHLIREYFRAANRIDIHNQFGHRANMENNELAIQDIPNHHGYDAGKWLSCPCFPDQQEIDAT
uniref:PiggyBac transposable element-derived protein domain-containing protein n=1 Tax=Cryptomonas curvata TaxID=233186 RepID=A0A7S0QP21_9CRYP|mmetsp:Transcript_41182/g.85979  ORF Transcript_41182/g.85979 Transcript_41182/m.85979 type:complete len:250 (+) Transcript_41182:490-1239(+)